MIKREFLYYARQFLNATPTHSLSGVLASVEEGYACFKLSDGDSTATLDFFFRNAAEARAAQRKITVLKGMVDELERQITKQLADYRPALEEGTGGEPEPAGFTP